MRIRELVMSPSFVERPQCLPSLLFFIVSVVCCEIEIQTNSHHPNLQRKEMSHVSPVNLVIRTSPSSSLIEDTVCCLMSAVQTRRRPHKHAGVFLANIVCRQAHLSSRIPFLATLRLVCKPPLDECAIEPCRLSV